MGAIIGSFAAGLALGYFLCLWDGGAMRWVRRFYTIWMERRAMQRRLANAEKRADDLGRENKVLRADLTGARAVSQHFQRRLLDERN